MFSEEEGKERSQKVCGVGNEGNVGRKRMIIGGMSENGKDFMICVFRSALYMLWLKTVTYWGGFGILGRITTSCCNGSPHFF